MRLLFIVPSNAHKTSAGARIRYDRLALSSDYFDVSIQSIGELTRDDLISCDVCILSKTYSSEAIAIAQAVKSMGKIVGLDLFDDYFTQWGDSRLLRFRRWLQRACEVCDFALCSTGVMRGIVGHYAPELPAHILPDLYPEIDPEAMAPIVAEKLARAQGERSIDLLWFGIGSNPLFSVGLQDLAAYASDLRALASGGFKPILTILTNRPALRPERLAQLSRLPIDYRIEFWSLEAEREALAKAFACFLPVNGQSFSRAKSLNRALTAISAGAQVLSPGFPLYAELDPVIYRDPAEVVVDAQTGRCRIREDNVAEVARIVAQTSAVRSVASDLSIFLEARIRESEKRESSRAQPGRIALIYGLTLDVQALMGANAAGVLSIASPFVQVERAYDVRFDYTSGRRFDIWITPQMKGYLAPDLGASLGAPVKRGKLKMHKVDVGDAALLEKAPLISPGDSRPILQETEAYRSLLGEVERVCRILFPAFQFSLADINASRTPAVRAPSLAVAQ
jgi:hypothetical protein